MIKKEITRHPKCKGYVEQIYDITEYGCGYETTINCEDCKYLLENNGKGKNPEAKCNQSK